MKKTRRTNQLGDVVRNELALIIQREIREPELGFVTVTGVELSTDLRFARVHISVLSGDKQKSVDLLKENGSKIRYMLGQRASLRYTPELDFRLDETLDRATAIEDILKEVLPAEKKENDGSTGS